MRSLPGRDDMRLEVVNGLVGFVGKISESNKATDAITELAQYMNIKLDCAFDNSVESSDFMDISAAYDMDEYSVSDVKRIWKNNKKAIMGKLMAQREDLRS